LARDDGNRHWRRLFFLFLIEVLADLADCCDVSDAAADCGNGFTDGFSDRLLNGSGDLF